MGLVAIEQIKETVILLWLLEYFISEDLALMHKFPLCIFYWLFNLIFQGECLYCSIYCARRRYQKKAPNGPNKTLLTSWLSFGAFRLERYWTQFFFWPNGHVAILWPKTVMAAQFLLQNSHFLFRDLFFVFVYKLTNLVSTVRNAECTLFPHMVEQLE